MRASALGLIWDVARVNKSDKVEAAGCRCRAMEKALACVSDFGLSFADFGNSDQQG